MNSVIDISEASAMRKRFMQTAEDAHGQYLRHRARNGHRGCQRTGPAHRRALADIRHYLKPVIALDQQLQDGYQHFLMGLPSPNGRLRPVSFAVHPKQEPRVFQFNAELSAHAFDRLIQHYRIRDFSRMPQPLADVVLALFLAAREEVDPRDNHLSMINDQGELDGHLVLIESKEETALAVTFVGVRSYIPRRKRQIGPIHTQHGKDYCVRPGTRNH
jgi:hypothetical protein